MGTILLPVSREVDDLLAAICEGEEDQRLELELLSINQNQVDLDEGTRAKELAELNVLQTGAAGIDEDLKSLVAHLGNALNLSLSVSDVSKFLDEEEEDEEDDEDDDTDEEGDEDNDDSDDDEEGEKEVPIKVEPSQKSPLSRKSPSIQHKDATPKLPRTSTPKLPRTSTPKLPRASTPKLPHTSTPSSEVTITTATEGKSESELNDILCLSELKSKARQISVGSNPSLVGTTSSDSAPEDVDWGAYLTKLLEMGTNKLQTKNLGDSGNNWATETPAQKENNSVELKASSDALASPTLASPTLASDQESRPKFGIDSSKVAEVAKALPPRYSKAICAAIASELEELHRVAALTEEKPVAAAPKSPPVASPSQPAPPSSQAPESEPPSLSQILKDKEEEEIKAVRKILPEAALYSRLSTMLSKATDEALENFAISLESGAGPKAKAVMNPVVERERAFSEPTRSGELSPYSYSSKCFSESNSLVNSVSSSSPISAASTSSWISDEDEYSSSNTSPFSSLTPRERESALTTRSMKNGTRPMNTLARRSKINEAVGIWSQPEDVASSAASFASTHSDGTASQKSSKHKSFLLSALASRHLKRESSSGSVTKRSRPTSMVQESTRGKGLVSDRDRKKAEKAEKAERAAQKKAEKHASKIVKKDKKKMELPTIGASSKTLDASSTPVTTTSTSGCTSHRPQVGPLPTIPSILDRKGKSWLHRNV